MDLSIPQGEEENMKINAFIHQFFTMKNKTKHKTLFMKASRSKTIHKTKNMDSAILQDQKQNGNYLFINFSRSKTKHKTKNLHSTILHE
jgi:hypothetical protein